MTNTTKDNGYKVKRELEPRLQAGETVICRVVEDSHLLEAGTTVRVSSFTNAGFNGIYATVHVLDGPDAGATHYSYDAGNLVEVKLAYIDFDREFAEAQAEVVTELERLAAKLISTPVTRNDLGMVNYRHVSTMRNVAKRLRDTTNYL